MSPSRRVQKGGRTASPPGNMTNTSSSTACGRRRRSSPRASAAPREVDRDPLLRRRLEHLHERAQEIGVRHDPDQRVAVRDGQRAEARIEHESRRVFDPGLRGYRHGIRGHDPTGDRAGRLGAGGPNVSVRDHPHQPPPGHDRQVPDAVLVHEASRRVARRLGPDSHQPAGHHISHHDHDHVAVLPARYGAEHSSTLVPSGIGRTSAETRSSAFVATSASATAIPGAVSSSVASPSGKAMTASSRPFSVMPSPRCVIGGIRLHAGGQNHRTLAPGPVREDYSASGDAWQYFSHDQARSRAYRWGEDGLGGISDDRQLLCFALALWNGQDPILKERLFGLTNSEGNHGEDVKEYYFYLDSTPTHSYMKYLYKYPQPPYPYSDLVDTNRHRGKHEFEYELIDTGVFDDNRYFDVFVEYAKASPEDILVQLTVDNRGPEPATLHALPTLWFRNTWSWGDAAPRQALRQAAAGPAGSAITASHPDLGERVLYAEGAASLLFTENETNTRRLVGVASRTPYVKDGINDYVVHGREASVNPEKTGTKASLYYTFEVPAGGSRTVRLRLTDAAPVTNGVGAAFGDAFDGVMQACRLEADEFYASVVPSSLDKDAANVMRQALAGMLWSKQFYHYDVDRWLSEHGADPFSQRRQAPRNGHWHHMHNAHILSMPDKWEYPWYAAWDLAFHVLALSLVDENFGKQQLDLMLHESYLHPSGQLPAYEWNFGDVNPPVHAWSTIYTYRLEKARHGRGDLDWLERAFHKLLLNFTWWVNRKDRTGNNAFEGGFLGLDNIGVFDRSAPLPTGGYLEQADGTAWMALFCQNMLEITGELAMERPGYVDLALKFAEHFLWIGSAMMHAGQNVGMWDEEDGFFYDVLRLPDGSAQRLKVRSMVGLLPLCAVTEFDGKLMEKYPPLRERMRDFLTKRPELTAFIHNPGELGHGGRRLAAE